MSGRARAVAAGAGLAALAAAAIVVTAPIVFPGPPTQAGDTIWLPGDEASSLPSGHTRTDQVVRLESLSGPAPQTVYGVWREWPVLIAKFRVADMTDDALRLAVPVAGEPDAVLVGFVAKSPHHGCTVAFEPMTTQPDARAVLLDPCRQWTWDPTDAARLVATSYRTDIPRLPLLELVLDGTAIQVASLQLQACGDEPPTARAVGVLYCP